MTIRQFLLGISAILVIIGVYFHIEYLQNSNFQKNSTPIIDYYITDIANFR